MNTLTRTILSEKVKTPNIHGLSKDELQDMMIEILEKVSKNNVIHFSAFEEILKDKDKVAQIFKLLRFGEMNNRKFESSNIENKRNNKQKR